MIPDELQYTAEHEWVRDNGDGTITFGVTDYAQDSLGDIVYVSLPAVGDALVAGEPCGEIESTKSVSDIYAPVSGTVSAVNDQLDDAPDVINGDPYGDGWMVQVTTAEGVPTLLTADAYRALTES